MILKKYSGGTVMFQISSYQDNHLNINVTVMLQIGSYVLV